MLYHNLENGPRVHKKEKFDEGKKNTIGSVSQMEISVGR